MAPPLDVCSDYSSGTHPQKLPSTMAQHPRDLTVSLESRNSVNMLIIRVWLNFCSCVLGGSWLRRWVEALLGMNSHPQLVLTAALGIAIMFTANLTTNNGGVQQ